MAEQGKLRALIAGGSRDYILALKKDLERTGFFEKCTVAYSGNEALEKNETYHPDLIVTDIILRGLDGLGLLEKIQCSGSGRKCKIIVCTLACSDFIIRKAFEYGADFFLIKPFAYQTFRDTLVELLGLVSKKQCTSFGNIDAMIVEVIQRIGLPPGSKGYHYAKWAIKQLLGNPSLANHMTTKLYPAIAEQYNSTAGRVERNIRHAIEVAWNKGDLEYIEQLFGYTIDENKGKPTNTAFLVTIANFIQLRLYRIN